MSFPQACKHSIELFRYALLSTPELFPGVGTSLPDRPEEILTKLFFLTCCSLPCLSNTFPLSFFDCVQVTVNEQLSLATFTSGVDSSKNKRA